MAGQWTSTTKFRGECVACRTVPVVDGRVRPMLVAVGIDVNWGEDLNICETCAGVMADLLGRPDDDTLTKQTRLETENQTLKDRLDHVAGERDDLQSRIDRMLDGKSAVKEAREARRSAA